MTRPHQPARAERRAHRENRRDRIRRRVARWVEHADMVNPGVAGVGRLAAGAPTQAAALRAARHTTLPVHDRRQVDANDVDPTVTRHPVRSARLTS